MSGDAILDAERALGELHGPDKGGDDNLRRLNAASFVGERYGSALVSDWRSMMGALKLIDVMLTSAEGDNIPRGEAPKHAARLLARKVIGWGDAEDTQRAWGAATERAARAFYEQNDPDGWDGLDYESKESRRCAAEHALIAAMEVLEVESTDG